MIPSRTETLNYLELGFRYGQITVVGSVDRGTDFSGALLLRVCTEFHLSLSRFVLQPVIDKAVAQIRLDFFSHQVQSNFDDPSTWQGAKERIAAVFQLVRDSYSKADQRSIALDAGTLLGRSQRELDMSTDRHLWAPRILKKEGWDWKFQDALLLKNLLHRLGLVEADVVRDLIVNPRQPAASSTYEFPFDLHGKIERNIRRLQTKTYLGLELGADYTQPIRREGWPHVEICLEPRHFYVLSLYCRAGEEYTTKTIILQDWPTDPDHSNDDVVHQANTFLRRELKKVGLKIELGPGSGAKWRLEEISLSGL